MIKNPPKPDRNKPTTMPVTPIHVPFMTPFFFRAKRTAVMPSASIRIPITNIPTMWITRVVIVLERKTNSLYQGTSNSGITRKNNRQLINPGTFSFFLMAVLESLFTQTSRISELLAIISPEFRRFCVSLIKINQAR